ncbi:MAG: high-affinity nickel-transport family protein [Patescibacteria group bacterium]
MNLLTILILGLLLGIRHATDPDHVIAVTTIVSKQRHLKLASIIGAVWGIGHTVTIFLMGAFIIFFHVVIPPRLGLFFEFCVALLLIVLGVLNLTGVLQRIMTNLNVPGFLHTHLHLHGGDPHVHIHKHMEETLENPGKKTSLSNFIQKFGIFGLARPLIIGVIHGLAGSAAIALLILGSITEASIAMIYLLVFGMGTIIGMMGITTLIGVPIIISSKKYQKIDRYINVASGIISLIFGAYLAYQIGIVNGLFGAVPTWNPH